MLLDGRFAVGVLLALGLVACGDDAGGGSGGSNTGGNGAGLVGTGNSGTGNSGTGNAGAGNNGGAPPPGPSADGWESAYEDGGVGLDCDDTAADMASSGAPSLTFGDTTIYVGFEQIGDNQNPIVARFDGDTKVYCQVHETEGPDGRALGITWDGGDYAYVVYTIVGGGSSLEGKGGWLSSYAPGSISGGGPKVSVVGRVETTGGALENATFVIAVKSDNKVNSHSPAGPVTVLENGDVEFLGGSAHKPIDVDKEAMDCTDYPFDSRYHFTPDLSDVVCAECTNCNAESPCSST